MQPGSHELLGTNEHPREDGVNPCYASSLMVNAAQATHEHFADTIT